MKKIVIEEVIVLPENEKLTATVHLADSSILHLRERYKEGRLIKYSYHIMKGDKFIRWDNVPHHENIKTYPHHKHENKKIIESKKMNIKLIFDELNI